MPVDSWELATEEILFNEEKAREAAKLLKLNSEIFIFLLRYVRDDDFDSDSYIGEEGHLPEELIKAIDEFDQMIKEHLEGNSDSFIRIEKAMEIDPYFEGYVVEKAAHLYANNELDEIGRSGIERKMEHNPKFAREVLEIASVTRALVRAGAIYRGERN